MLTIPEVTVTKVRSTRNQVEKILAGLESGARLSDADAVALLESSDLPRLGQSAHAMRMRKKPDNIVSYIVDRNINYTDYCVSGCKFCAFYKKPADAQGYLLTRKQMDDKIDQTVALGGAQVLMQGGLHPDHTIEWYEDMLIHIKANHAIHIHAFSPPEIVHISGKSGLSVPETIRRLKSAGLDSIPGGGAEILVDRVRKLASPGKCSADEWIEVMRHAHDQGLPTTATMMFGHLETIAERVESLRRIRDLQDQTGGFTAFIPWPFQPENTRLCDIAPSGGFDYLKTLAVSRLYLDNFDNIQASWVTQGPKIAQVALLFGAPTSL